LKAKGEEAFENATKSLNQREMVAEKGPTDSAIVVDDRTTAHIEDMPDFF
jgi:hypothetical protein